MWRNSFVIFIKYICHGGFWLPLERVHNSKHFLFIIWTNLCMQKSFCAIAEPCFHWLIFFFFVSLSEVKRMRGILCSGFCESSSVFSSMTTTSDDAAALKFKSRAVVHITAVLPHTHLNPCVINFMFYVDSV